MSEHPMNSRSLSGTLAETLLRELATWGNTTTIILHGGCVFEFKGNFPVGQIGHGFYNLKNEGNGFEGHISLQAIDNITFQDKPHRGRESYAFNFRCKDNESIFKVFLGRDLQGELLPTQVSRFKQIQQSMTL